MLTAQTLKQMAEARPGSRIWTQLREDIGCVKARDPAARHTFEIVLTYPGVHALILHRLSNRLWRKGLRFPARLLSWFGRLITNVDIHPGATIGRRLFIDHGAGVVIGETAVIGDDVTLYHGVTLGGTSWSPRQASSNRRKRCSDWRWRQNFGANRCLRRCQGWGEFRGC
jgi:serine O-acetyltransferase